MPVTRQDKVRGTSGIHPAPHKIILLRSVSSAADYHMFVLDF